MRLSATPQSRPAPADRPGEVLLVTTPDRSELLYVSSNYEQVWGRTRESLYHNPGSWIEAIHPEDRDAVREALESELLVTSPPLGDLRYRITRPDGTARWILSHTIPVQDHTGRVESLVEVAQDVTEQTRLQQELCRAAQLQLKALTHVLHHFANYVIAVNACSSLLLSSLSPQDPLRAAIEEIYRAGSQAVALTRFPRTSTRRTRPKPRRPKSKEQAASRTMSEE